VALHRAARDPVRGTDAARRTPLDTLLTAARNAWAISWLGVGVEAPSPRPAVVVYDEPHAQLRRFTSVAEPVGKPVLLVPPLAVPASCWDLRPGQSLAGHLVDGDHGQGRATYVIDYGDITFADRRMGFEDWIERIIPAAIRRISAEHGGSEVHLVAWSLGGTVSLLTAAHDPSLPIASIAAVGTPIDYRLNASSQPLRWLDNLLGTKVMTAPTAALGGVPAGLVQVAFRATAPVRELTKPWFLVRNLHNTEALARTEAIDRFMDAMPGYPGRLYHQMHTRLIARHELADGVVRLSRKLTVDLSRITAPVMLIGSATDAIASAAAIEAGVRVLPDAHYVAADGLSHLGLIAGPTARDQSWPAIEAHLLEND
jgi:polyhydroxyalkanoate synthase